MASSRMCVVLDTQTDSVIKNEGVAEEFLWLIDEIKNKGKKEMKVNLHMLEVHSAAPPRCFDEEEQKEADCHLSRILFARHSRTGYDEVVREMNILRKSGPVLPSHYKMRKTRHAEFEPFIFNADVTNPIFVFGEDNDHPAPAMQDSPTVGSRIVGTFTDHLNLMKKKWMRENVAVAGDAKPDWISICSYDGAEHLKSDKGRINVTSYSTNCLIHMQSHQD